MRQAQRTGGRAAGRTAGRTDRDRRRRELSQNYLRGPDAARQFLRAVRLDPDGLCVEVGAGEGILTTRLASMCREVVAYEVDLALADRLRERLRGPRQRPPGHDRLPGGPAAVQAVPGGRQRAVLADRPDRRLVPALDPYAHGHAHHPAGVRQEADRRLRPVEPADVHDLAAGQLGTAGKAAADAVPPGAAGGRGHPAPGAARDPAGQPGPAAAPTGSSCRRGSAASAARCRRPCAAPTRRTGSRRRARPRAWTDGPWWPSSARISGCRSSPSLDARG